MIIMSFLKIQLVTLYRIFAWSDSKNYRTVYIEKKMLRKNYNIGYITFDKVIFSLSF